MTSWPHLLTDADKVIKCPKHLMTEKQWRPCDDQIWGRIKGEYGPYNIFINIPYLDEYADLQAAIIATVLKVGMIPQMASLRSEGQAVRLCKICEMMQTSKYCITDVSYDSSHNIPFELGFFLALGRQGHSLILVDEKTLPSNLRKFDSRMSNLKGLDVISYNSKREVLVGRLIDRMKSDVPEAVIKVARARLINDILRTAKKVKAVTKTGALPEFIESYRDAWRSSDLS